MLLRIRSFWYGLTLPLRAMRLIATKPSLLLWSAIPVLVTLAIYGFVIHHLQAAAQLALGQYFFALGWDPQGWSAWILMFLTKILLYLVGAVTFSMVATVISSPFNDYLAERAERFTSPTLMPMPRLSWSRKARLIFIDLSKSLAATAITILALFVSWVPILNIFAMALTFTLFTFQFVSYPQTRRAEGLSDGIRFVWKHFFSCLGFGMVISGLFAIPLISSFAVPVAVVGGTLLYARAASGDLR